MQPTIVTKNQFGEQTNNFIIGGTNDICVNFIPDVANGNGFGQRSLKNVIGNYVANVFMNTSSTPAAGNPNPIAGYAKVVLTKAFLGYVKGIFGAVAPLSGTPVNVTSGLTLGHVYTITSLGTTTAAAWHTLGLDANTVPALGVAFSAITASAGSGTGAVQESTSSGIATVELVGDPNATVNPLTGGGYFWIKFLNGSGAATAPAAGSVVSLTTSLQNPTAGPTI